MPLARPHLTPSRALAPHLAVPIERLQMNAVFATVLLHGALPESNIIKQAFGVFVVWTLAVMLTSFVALHALRDHYN
jgi:hypothetical protein